MYLKDYRIRSFLSIRHAHGELCKHLGIDSSTDLDDRYSNLFLKAYINRHAHTEYLKMIEVYSYISVNLFFLSYILIIYGSMSPYSIAVGGIQTQTNALQS